MCERQAPTVAEAGTRACRAAVPSRVRPQPSGPIGWIVSGSVSSLDDRVNWEPSHA